MNSSTQAPRGFFAELGHFLKNSLSALKNPKQLLPTLGLGIVWILLSMLSAFGFRSGFLNTAIFLTFADGGMFGGIWGAAGGILGKVVTAVFFNTVIVSLFRKGSEKPGFFKGLGKMVSSIFGKGSGSVAPLFAGAGLALLLYAFMNCTESFQSSIVGLMSAVLVISGLFKQSGLCFSLLFSILSAVTKGHTPSYGSVNKALSGMALGFASGTALSAAKLAICKAAGLGFLVLAIVLGILAKKKGGAEA